MTPRHLVGLLGPCSQGQIVHDRSAAAYGTADGRHRSDAEGDTTVCVGEDRCQLDLRCLCWQFSDHGSGPDLSAVDLESLQVEFARVRPDGRRGRRAGLNRRRSRRRCSLSLCRAYTRCASARRQHQHREQGRSHRPLPLPDSFTIRHARMTILISSWFPSARNRPAVAPRPRSRARRFRSGQRRNRRTGSVPPLGNVVRRGGSVRLSSPVGDDRAPRGRADLPGVVRPQRREQTRYRCPRPDTAGRTV